MEIELLNRISDLNLYGYFDPSKNMITVHFFNAENEKPDIIAYLKHDMSWDVREIIEEKSELFDDKEVVTISHMPISVEIMGSKFDMMARKSLEEMARKTYGEDANLSEINHMFMILLNNSYFGDVKKLN